MFNWLKSQRPMQDCGAGTPVQHLHRHGMLGPDVIAVHANCLGEDDARLIGERGASVVHCPRSHAYFKHPRFPIDQLFAAGVNLCLGTDSLASVRSERRRPPRLSMFEELRELANREPALGPEELLRLATVNGARALGLAGKLGELRPGAGADLIAVTYDGPVRSAGAALVEHREPVRASMINGEWVIPPSGRA
jgi:cytosine/adenosine deaminase-related metal-dependent hydrolase